MDGDEGSGGRAFKEPQKKVVVWADVDTQYESDSDEDYNFHGEVADDEDDGDDRLARRKFQRCAPAQASTTKIKRSEGAEDYCRRQVQDEGGS